MFIRRGTDGFKALQKAMNYSQKLMETEYYSMRLEAEGNEEDESTWPEEIKAVTLSEEDQQLLSYEKNRKRSSLSLAINIRILRMILQRV